MLNKDNNCKLSFFIAKFIINTIELIIYIPNDSLVSYASKFSDLYLRIYFKRYIMSISIFWLK
jgi:hypothetical protein